MKEDILNTNNWFNYQSFYDIISSEPTFSKYVELGVWKGHSISYLADKLRYKAGVEIYAVDIFEEWNKNKNVLDEVKNISNIYNENLLRMNVRHLIQDIRCISWEAAYKFEDESVDFVFIDADHSYDSVLKDIRSWYPKIKPNGIISGHDYRHDPAGMGVVTAVNESFLEFKLHDGGVWYHRK